MGALASRFKRGTEVFSKVWEALSAGPLHRDVLAQRLGVRVERVAVYLSKMKSSGVVRRIAPSTWEAVPVSEWPETRGKLRTPRPKGAAHPSWKGGRYICADGYVLVMVGKDAPMADARGYAYEHRLVVSQMLGRPLRTEEQVHHKDQNRQNNDPSNLEVLTLPEHKVEHRILDKGRRLPGEKNPTIACRCGCGTTFQKFDSYGRPRQCAPGHNRTGRKLGRKVV